MVDKSLPICSSPILKAACFIASFVQNQTGLQNLCNRRCQTLMPVIFCPCTPKLKTSSSWSLVNTSTMCRCSASGNFSFPHQSSSPRTWLVFWLRKPRLLAWWKWWLSSNPCKLAPSWMISALVHKGPKAAAPYHGGDVLHLDRMCANAPFWPQSFICGSFPSPVQIIWQEEGHAEELLRRSYFIHASWEACSIAFNFCFSS